MRPSTLLGLALVSALALGAAPASQGETPAKPATARSGGGYVPPPPEKRLSGGRVGGGTRSIRPGACGVRPVALVPEDHGGLTAASQPILFYYLPQDTACTVQFILNDRRQVPPLVEKPVATPGRAGIHGVRLAELGLTLEPGVEYDWFVQLSPGGVAGSPEAFSGGQVRRLAAPDEAPSSALWYEAVAAAFDAGGASGGGRTQQQQELLAVVGLDPAAAGAGAR